jgi:hypothetical protein
MMMNPSLAMVMMTTTTLMATVCQMMMGSMWVQKARNSQAGPQMMKMMMNPKIRTKASEEKSGQQSDPRSRLSAQPQQLTDFSVEDDDDYDDYDGHCHHHRLRHVTHPTMMRMMKSARESMGRMRLTMRMKELAMQHHCCWAETMVRTVTAS